MIPLGSDDPGETSRDDPRLTRLEADLRAVRRWAFGNGTRGADERLRKVEDAMGGLNSVIEKLDARLDRIDARQDARDEKDKADRKARKYLAYGVVGTLVALAIAGVQFVTWLSERIELILRAMSAASPPPF